MACLLVAAPATAQVNYAVSGGTAYVGRSPGASGAIVIASTYNGFPVTSIVSGGAGAFEGCSGLTSVTIPSSVTNIGSFAFRDCTSLTNISVDAANPAYSSPNGVLFDKAQTTLITFPFGRSGSYVIPNTVTSIVTEAFYRCFGLTNVTIPNSVTNIGSYVFYQCNSLTSVTIPDSVTSLQFRSFELCGGLTNVIIGNSVTNIADYLFYGCSSLANVTIGNSVASIGVAAFQLCPSLTSVTIPNSVTHIRDIAFNGTNLRSVTIPNSVTNIRDNAFIGCPSLTNFSVAAANPAYSSLDGVLFDKAQTTLIAFPFARGDRSYVIPDSVTRIVDQVFSGTSMTNVTLGNSLTSIGASAFQNCTALASVTIPNSVIDIGDSAFSGCRNLTGLTIPNNVTNIGVSAFNGCTNLTSLTIGNSVISIGSGAFSGCRVTNVILGNSVTRIGSAAFWGCTNVASVTFPSSLTSIEDGAFFGCRRLTNFTFLGNAPALIRGFYEGSWFAGVGAGAKAYYYCGTTGWGPTYGGLPTVMLCPPQMAPGSAGMKPGGFGFTLTRLTNQTIVVEASTNLLNWQPIWTNPPPGASTNFVDPEWLNHSNRFYRARSD